MREVNYWHMQMHPDDKSFAEQHVYEVLEHNKIIGLGNWERGESTIAAFKNEMQVNDIVAIKNGRQLVALVQVIGGCYAAADDSSPINWIENHRPIRILDWAVEEKLIPQARGTLAKCVNDVDTTKVIKNWHSRVNDSFKKRKLALSV